MHMDSEDRRNRFTAAMDCVRDLVGGSAIGMTIQPEPLAQLLDLLTQEAHALYDDKRVHRGLRSND